MAATSEVHARKPWEAIGGGLKVDLSRLRQHLRPFVDRLASYTHNQLAEKCEEVGLLAPPSERPRDTAAETHDSSDGRSWTMTKRERVSWSFDNSPDETLPHVAIQMMSHGLLDASGRNAVQDTLWADDPSPCIPKKFRRELAQSIDIEDLFIDVRRFDELLGRLWVLDEPGSISWLLGSDERSLRGRIQRHVYANPGDWSTDELFDRIGAFEASDRRFALFLEGLAGADVRPDEMKQRAFAEQMNLTLRKCGIELRETDSQDGYPVFRCVSLHSGRAGRAKNLIFACPQKPDLRFRDAVNNDIEIVTNSECYLVYDRPIGMEGLRWCELQAWWASEMSVLDPREAKRGLYKRLLESLPSNSPPQRTLFKEFFNSFKTAIPSLPALLPEVWLHWDPKTVRERGPKALARFRMDFLLLLPAGVRVVVEVDGMHHYASPDGKADPGRYSSMMAADRELRLAGYEVFRFGASELIEGQSQFAVKHFFESLFGRYGVTIPKDSAH